jgi:uncharacterized protein YyaL (SSP411 family)
MAHESFENEAIARVMNENFVNIKVDREERPDIDQIYMNAVQMMTHHGGWPMTVFLTPDGVPFYGGTYFPPEDRYNMPGFPRVLLSVAEAYRDRPEDIVKTTDSLLAELRRVSVGGASDLIAPDLLDEAFQGIVKSYDPVEGGFGGAPKFPPAMTLEFLLRTYSRTGQQQALEIVNHTCRKMANGGMYDQLGGGFHRYATDAKWLVPHFEKMLYDNAQLSRLYLHWYQVTRDPFARGLAQGILDYVLREMTHEAGGFYSSQDADSEGEEGKFFVWSLEEVERILGVDDAQLFSAFYNLSRAGNFEGRNILNVTRSAEEVAAAEAVSVERLNQAVERGQRLLFEEREKRVRPHRDEKVLTAWNGLMLISFAEAAIILGQERYQVAATRNADFLLRNLQQDGLLLRSWKDGQAKFNGYLEDYAFLIDGLVTLYETTGELRWFDAARSLANKMIEEFWDESEGGFFFTGKSHEQLIIRSKDYFDNATPSGNSVAAGILLRLAVLTEDSDYERLAATALQQVGQLARRYPTGFGWALGAMDFHVAKIKEVVLVGEESEQTKRLLKEVWAHFLPNKVVAIAALNDPKAKELIPLLESRTLVDGKATAYVCEQRVCRSPVTTIDGLQAQLLS